MSQNAKATVKKGIKANKVYNHSFNYIISEKIITYLSEFFYKPQMSFRLNERIINKYWRAGLLKYN